MLDDSSKTGHFFGGGSNAAVANISSIMKLVKALSTLIGVLGLVAILPEVASGANVAKLNERITQLTGQFEELMQAPRTRIPGYVLKRAEGIIIFRKHQVALFGGVKGGNGVALARDPSTREWSQPLFIRTAEGSFGLQIGVHRISAVLIVMKPDLMRKLSETNFRIGVDAAAAAGPAGVEANAEAGLEEVLVYSNTKGLFAGVSIEGGLILPNKRANKIFHGEGSRVLPLDILYGDRAKPSESGNHLIATISKYELK